MPNKENFDIAGAPRQAGKGIPYHPTDEQRQWVKTMVATGAEHGMIAHMLGISHDTVQRHYGEELKTGAAEANAAIASRLFEDARAGNTVAQIFWLKCRAGWRDKDAYERLDNMATPAPAPIPANDSVIEGQFERVDEHEAARAYQRFIRGDDVG